MSWNASVKVFPYHTEGEKLTDVRKPDWLKIKFKSSGNMDYVDEIIRQCGLNTVCVEAMCPNRAECFSKRTATFMILGRNCTRNCTFCNVSRQEPDRQDPGEPLRVAEAVMRLGLRYVVITSVTRDDLDDGGASQFVNCIREIRKKDDCIKVEVLVPDFSGNAGALKSVVMEKPFVLNHNVETVRRLYPEVRPSAVYDRSLGLLKKAKETDSDIRTKSGIMLGLGETKEEVVQTLLDIRAAGVDLLTIGQYLAPSRKHHNVARYVHPDEFDEYKRIAIEMGFLHAASGPFVRSSYNAAEAVPGLLSGV